MKKSLIALGVLGFAVVSWVVYDDPERDVLKTLERGRAALEAGDVEAAMRWVAPDYRDAYGFNWIMVKRSLEYFAGGSSGLRVEYSVAGMRRRGDSLLVDLAASAGSRWRGEPKDWVGTELAPENLTLVFQRQILRWKVSGSLWAVHPAERSRDLY